MPPSRELHIHHGIAETFSMVEADPQVPDDIAIPDAVELICPVPEAYL